MMLQHLMKLVWKRKARNLMVSLEILIAFALVFGACAFGARMLQLYAMPTGFQYEDVWSVRIRATDREYRENDPSRYDAYKRSVEAMPQVEKVAFSTFSPYRRQIQRNDFVPPGGGARIYTHMLSASDDFAATVGMRLQQGRWFSAVDDGASSIPVVIDQGLAARLFPGRSALGREFSDSEPEDKAPRTLKVVGVIEAYRSQGELMTPENFMFVRFVPASSNDSVSTIIVKVKPGTPRAFEADLNRRLKLVRNDLTYEIAPLSDLRDDILKSSLIPLILFGVIAAFMLLMVGFGLFGVLWQTTTARIPEIGLRRALGATSAAIYGQIVAEQLLLSSGAMAVALLLLVQLPLTHAFGASLDWTVFGAAAAVSMALVYLLSLACALYPGWRASRLSPTQALHYE
jgi:putative ABC transport system permease protein